MKPRYLADIALLTLAVQFGAQSPGPPIIELRIGVTKDHVGDRWRDGPLAGEHRDPPAFAALATVGA